MEDKIIWKKLFNNRKSTQELKPFLSQWLENKRQKIEKALGKEAGDFSEKNLKRTGKCKGPFKVNGKWTSDDVWGRWFELREGPLKDIAELEVITDENDASILDIRLLKKRKLVWSK